MPGRFDLGLICCRHACCDSGLCIWIWQIPIVRRRCDMQVYFSQFQRTPFGMLRLDPQVRSAHCAILDFALMLPQLASLHEPLCVISLRSQAWQMHA